MKIHLQIRGNTLKIVGEMIHSIGVMGTLPIGDD